MNIRTVGGLKEALQKNGLTPEALAPRVKISSMTLRRMLKKKDPFPIPEKYHAGLDLFFAKREVGFTDSLAILPRGGDSFEKLLCELERDGQRCNDIAKLSRDTKHKLKDRNIGAELRDLVLDMLRTVVNSKEKWRYRALCIGALLYFINPFDLIPDSIPVVGYLDDFAVLTLVAGIVAKKGLSRKRRESVPFDKDGVSRDQPCGGEDVH